MDLPHLCGQKGSPAMPALPSIFSRVWPLQLVVALVFTMLTVTIAGGLVLWNHAQLTRFAKREAHTNFETVSRMIRKDRETNRRTSELLLDAATSTIDPDLPPERLQTMLLELMRHVERALPSTFGLVMAWPDGRFLGVRDVTAQRAPEIVGLGGADAVLGLNVVDLSSGQPMESWILYDRSGREIARRPPQPTTYDARKRIWYEKALHSPRPILSPPYAFANAAGAGITLAQGMPGRPGIVFGLDITLADLDRLMAEGRTQSAAELVVFDRAGRLVSHADGEALRRRASLASGEILPRLADLGSPVLAAMETSFRANGLDQDTHFTVGGQAYIARFEPAGEAMGDFVIGLAVPEALLMGEAYRIRMVLLSAAALALLVALTLIFLAARRIVAPLRLASDSLGHIVALRFGHAPPIRSRIAEVSDLGRALATLEPLLQNFARYVPFALVRGMIDSTFSTELGGRRQPLCVLFSDIEGFTGLTERLDPDTLTRQMSRYFDEFGREIVRSKGTIDKYIGDSVMAFWNAPDRQEDYVRLACLGVLRAARRIERLNAEFRAEGAAEMPTRFGLHVGEAVVGNVGTADRMNYTALGHAVNLASRLEGLNREFGTTILVSEAVVEAAGDDFAFRRVGETVPRGASRPVKLYELTGAWIDDEPELAPPEDARAGWIRNPRRETRPAFDEAP
jgi:adenylate cyclase